MGCCAVSTLGGIPGGVVVAAPAAPLQGLLIAGLDPALPTGSVDTTVIEFTGAPTAIGAIPLASWCTVTPSATLGTTFTILQSGFFQVLLYMPMGSSWNAGVTLNATLAQRQSVALEANAVQVRGASFETFSGAIAIPPGHPIIPVTQADIAAGGGANVIRCHITDPTAPGTPPLAGAFLNPAACACQIYRVAPIAG